jgi:hypothetical protein
VLRATIAIVGALVIVGSAALPPTALQVSQSAGILRFAYIGDGYCYTGKAVSQRDTLEDLSQSSET